MPGIATVGALPGWGPQQDALGRRIYWSQDHKVFAPGGLVIDGSQSRDLTNLTVGGAAQYDVLQAGLVMGKEGASATNPGMYRNSIIGATTAQIPASATTSISVSAAVATEVQRLITQAGANVSLTLYGPATANTGLATSVNSQTVVATSASGTTISTQSFTPSQIFIAGTLVCPADGSQVPKCLIEKEDGIEIMDRFGNYYNAQFPQPLVGGAIESAQIVNYPSDTGLQAWLKNQLRAMGIGYVFRDDF